MSVDEVPPRGTGMGAMMGVGSPSALRAANRRRILDLLRREGRVSQADIARLSGLSRATVSNIVRELRDQHLVTVRDVTQGGRRIAQVALDRHAGIVIGLDFGHRHLRIAVADMSHTLLAETTHELVFGHSADDDLALICSRIDDLLDEAAVDRSAVVAVGMGLPAPIDPVTGQVGSPSILPGWTGVPAQEAMSYGLGLDVLVDNDANLGALAELSWGAGRGCSDLVYIKAATGIGAGLVLGGEIYHGAAGTAGEIGHTVIDERGAVCRCGNRGCLETFAGAPALQDLLRASHGDVTLARIIAMALDGDQGCRRVIADAGRQIGLAVANLCNLLAPQRVVIGGDLAAAGELLLEPLRDVVRRHAIRPAAQTAAIVGGVLGDRAEVLGAIALVLRSATRPSSTSVPAVAGAGS